MATNRHIIPTRSMVAPARSGGIGGLLVAAMAAALLVLLYHFQTNTQFAAVLALLLGFTAVSAVRLLQPRPSDGSTHIVFNENALLAQLSAVVNYVLPAPQTGPEALPWDVQAHDLVGKDNALALAKVRLDLERELRRLVEESNLARPRVQSVRNYAEVLEQAGVLPHAMRPSLIEVSRVTNAAVHGIEVPTDVAIGVVRVGEELVNILRSLPKPKEAA